MRKSQERKQEAMHIRADLKNTQENIANTESVIEQTDSEMLRAELKERNARREDAVDSFQMELDDRIAYKPSNK